MLRPGISRNQSWSGDERKHSPTDIIEQKKNEVTLPLGKLEHQVGIRGNTSRI
jgi:hypothetical protein